jgi:hypothetical protein
MILLWVALPVALLDLVVKLAFATPPWAFHERSLLWVVLCLGLVPALASVTRIPSTAVAIGAGLTAAGVIGNLTSALANGLRVPNPIILTGDGGVIAFNVADVGVTLGVILLMITIGAWLIRNRALLPSPAAIRATAVRAVVRTDHEQET